MIALLMNLFLVMSGVLLLIYDRRFKTTIGKVISSGKGGETKYQSVVEYDADGKTLHCKIDHSKEALTREGAAVKLKYDPEDPVSATNEMIDVTALLLIGICSFNIVLVIISFIAS